jgi:8-hydroxy-5-deazaflavin:NADPH oxidoreductase
VAAFNTVPSEVLFGVYLKRAGPSSRAWRVWGRSPCQVGGGQVVTLIRDLGFDPIDAGPARIARYIEPFALLVAQLAYEGKGGPELAYRFERLGT